MFGTLQGAALALALPGSTECAALLEETVQAAGSAALPGLCCVASNAQLGPTEVRDETLEDMSILWPGHENGLRA